jgi:large repetitive protein
VTGARGPIPRARRLGWGLALAALSAPSACGVGPIDAVVAPAASAGLAAYWSFDEGSGTTVLDHSGQGHDGTLTGGTWMTSGRRGGALYLALGDYVTVPSFPAATADWTISAWVRYAASDIGTDLSTIVTTEIPSTGGWELQGPVNSQTAELQFSYSRADGHYNTLICCQIQADTWMHVTAVVDGAALTATLYQGAVARASLAVDGPILPGTDTLHIGIEQIPTKFEWPFRGAVDEIRIYERALSAAEVQGLDAP